MEEVTLCNKGGKIFSFTSDMLAASINPPALYGNVDIEGGGRLMMDFTDCAIEDLQVGKKVDFLSELRWYDAKRDTTYYFWKAIPYGEVS
jgi:hydroxymethylglutaryl-CoA synthase